MAFILLKPKFCTIHNGLCHLSFHSGSHPTAAGNIPCEPLVLVGRLSPDHDNQDDQYSGEITFSDGTGSIVCEVSRTVSLLYSGSTVEPKSVTGNLAFKNFLKYVLVLNECCRCLEYFSFHEPSPKDC